MALSCQYQEISISWDNPSAIRQRVRENPTPRRSISWDILLPVLRLALVVYTQSECEEAVRSAVPYNWLWRTFPGALSESLMLSTVNPIIVGSTRP